jgi:hypothetical protein
MSRNYKTEFIMRIKNDSIFTLLFLFCAASALLDASTVDVRLLGVETSDSGFFLKHGADFEQIDVPLYQASEYYQAELNEAGVFSLYTKDATHDDPRFVAAVTGEIPTGANSVLAIYMLASDGSGRLYCYNDDWDEFPAQSYRLINISPVVINSKVGEGVLQLQPFESAVAEVEITSPLPTIKIITVYKDGQDRWQSIYNKRTALLPEWRLTGLAVVTRGKLSAAMGMPSSDHQATQAALRYLSLKDSARARSRSLATQSRAVSLTEVNRSY